jgi:hypothetical protein
MFVKFLNDRRIRKFWEEEQRRQSRPSALVKVSDNVWQRFYTDAQLGDGDGSETKADREVRG